MDEIVSFGSWLRQRRRALDVTQEALAKRAGCVVATIKKIEQDERRPSREMAERLAAALELAPEERAAFVKNARGLVAVEHAAIATKTPADAPSPARPQSNLPVQRKRLIGREHALAQLCLLVLRDDVGLVTLTGPGGVGKTRLSLQLAADLRDHFADGVWFIDLTPIREPALVVPTVGTALGLRVASEQPPRERLTAFLRDKQLLLVLDNFEQVLDAASEVADLLKSAPHLRVLVTSRAALHIYGEQEYPVQPLGLPNRSQLPPLVVLTQYPAVALFIQQALAVKPDFQVTSESAPAVAEICSRLDGLPLAIELAAARVKLFPPQALLARLEQRLTLLTGGARDLPTRHQTLRGTIDWSYSLLAPPERLVFTRLAVFSGGWTAEACEAICSGNGDLGLDVLHGLRVLLDNSLVNPLPDGDRAARFTMLETIREYAAERLDASDDAEELRRRHARYYLGLVETAERELRGPEQQAWLQRLDEDYDNLRAALVWMIERRETELGYRLVGALDRYWRVRGRLSEGRRHVEALLETSPAWATTARAKLYQVAGALVFDQGYVHRAIAHFEAALELARESGDKAAQAYALFTLGQSLAYRGDSLARAREHCEESLALAREVGEKRVTALALYGLGGITYKQGDFARARMLLQEKLTLERELGDKTNMGFTLLGLAFAAHGQDNDKEAEARIADALAVFREVEHKQGIAKSLYLRGILAHCLGNSQQAIACFAESLTLAREIGSLLITSTCLVGIATVEAEHQTDMLRVARLLAASERLRHESGSFSEPIDAANYQRTIAAVRSSIDDTTFRIAWHEGQAMSVEQAVAFALAASG